MAGAVFVVGGHVTAQQGPIASMVSTAGWARAAERVLGSVWIATPTGMVDADTALRRGSSPALTSPSHPRLRRLTPTVAKTAVKDARQYRSARRFRVEPEPEWRSDPPRFVWQRHEVFQDAGIRLAREIGVKSVLFVPATSVWEAARWGTRRPGWGRQLERQGEARILANADVVACGSLPVAEQVLRLGVDPDRVITTPTGVDVDAYVGAGDRDATRLRLGLEERFVIGWVGSFRRFHAVERAVEAAASIEGSRLLLVGDGPERRNIERLAKSRGVEVVATGTVPHHDLPDHLAAMDCGLVLARDDDSFHYSPLKVAEYLAAGVPVVAPRVGQLAERLDDGVNALLYAPDDDSSLVSMLRRLRDDDQLRRRLGAGGQQTAAVYWSWDRQVRRVLDLVEKVQPRV